MASGARGALARGKRRDLSGGAGASPARELWQAPCAQGQRERVHPGPGAVAEGERGQAESCPRRSARERGPRGAPGLPKPPLCRDKAPLGDARRRARSSQPVPSVRSVMARAAGREPVPPPAPSRALGLFGTARTDDVPRHAPSRSLGCGRTPGKLWEGAEPRTESAVGRERGGLR